MLGALIRRRDLATFLSEHGAGFHYGKFSNFEAARAWLPPSAEFDSESLSDEYINVRTQRVYPNDYPVMYWLREAFASGAASIWDLGGSVGIHYYAYGRYMPFPPGLQWDVHELAVVARLGRALASSNRVPNLRFHDGAVDPATIRADVWISAGVIEFLEDLDITELLQSVAKKPAHVLLNKVPLYDGPDFVSTHNLGKGSFAPHRVFSRERLVARIQSAGYKLTDAWQVPDRLFTIPGQPEHSFDHYSGLYFRIC
jgi:putative methyltransferase (TIGR04325 family)